jgi:hypothetical protein
MRISLRSPQALGLLAVALLFSAGVASGASRGFREWATIHNARFGFSIAYPSDILFPIDTPSGAEGRVLQSRDGQAKLLVATFENSEQTTLEAYRDFLLGSTYAEAKIDYAPLKARWFVLSGTRGGSMIYERVTFSCGGRLINSWAMVYPTSQRRLYDRVVEAISTTYTAGAGADGTCRDIGGGVASGGSDTGPDANRQPE